MRFSSTRPVSSPGRVENYPPLLMRFLRTSIGSKSRGRSRSSPIFFRRKTTPATETQEPSSPKVTCMGQVRMTRSKISKPGPGRVAGKSRQRRRRCWWVKGAFFCQPSAGKLRQSFFSPVWRKWVSFSHASFSGKSEKRRSSSTRSEPILSHRSTVQRDDAEEKEEEDSSSKSFTSIPPRNALLLTRCRSAPYRSSSLASRFWGSPVSGDQQEQSHGEETEQVPTQPNQPEDGNAPPQNMSLSESGESEKSEDSVGESERKSGNNSGDAKTEHRGSPRRRLRLTRCKSEPARMGERLVPELGFWKNTRLGFT